MTAHGRPILDAVLAQDAALVRKGWKPMTPWWRDQLSTFLDSKRFRFVARVGRQGTKSSTMERVAAATGAFVDHPIVQGRRGTVAFVSVKRAEADERLYGIRAIFDALGVRYRPGAEGSIELVDKPVIYRTFPASFRTAVGFTGLALFEDEVARMRDEESGANPAAEIDASMIPALVTQPLARAYSVSSPLGTEDFHATLFDRGTNASQYACEAATWIANSDVSEARTRELEPDERRWRREFAAIPQAGSLSAFDPDAVARAFVTEAPAAVSPSLVVDASSGRKDAWTWASIGWTSEPKKRLRVSHIGSIAGSFWKQVDGSEVVARVAAVAKNAGISTVHGDQRESLMLASEFRRHSLSYKIHDWTAASKPVAVERVRRWLADGVLAIDDHDGMRKELLRFEEKITASGAFTFAGARGSHDDFVALLITGALADLAGCIRGAPPAVARESVVTGTIDAMSLAPRDPGGVLIGGSHTKALHPGSSVRIPHHWIPAHSNTSSDGY